MGSVVQKWILNQNNDAISPVSTRYKKVRTTARNSPDVKSRANASGLDVMSRTGVMSRERPVASSECTTRPKINRAFISGMSNRRREKTFSVIEKDMKSMSSTMKPRIIKRPMLDMETLMNIPNFQMVA